MVHLGDITVSQRLLIGKNVTILLYRRGQDIDAVQQTHPLISGLGGKDCVEEPLNFYPAEIAGHVITALWIGEHVLDPHDAAEVRPTLIIHAS